MLHPGIILIGLLMTIQSAAQFYPTRLIPDSLKKNANSILREYNETLTITSINTTTIKVTSIHTILNKSGEESSGIYIHYDNNSTINKVEITLYDAAGNKIRRIKTNEIYDLPVNDISNYSDDRYRYYVPAYSSFPYTVAYEYEKTSTNCVGYGFFSPVSIHREAVQKATFTLQYPIDIAVNIKELNIQNPITEILENHKIHTWSLANLTAKIPEPYGVSLREFMPSVMVMPSVLKYNKYEGSANNWCEYGKWIHNLYEERDILPEATKADVLNKLAGITDTLEKIRAIYKYVQNTTRYVSIQLGIGGYQPFPAKTVAETGYGDCKALSNYTMALLKLINITSYPALVSSGNYQEKILKDFPNFYQFDHVILCVPYQKDTIWLECTDQEIPFGFLGDFTDDRDVLLITPQGGVFAHTTEYTYTKNIRVGRSAIKIDELGNAKCELTTEFSGIQFDNQQQLLNTDKEKQRKMILEQLDLPFVELTSFEVIKEDNIPTATTKINCFSKLYATFSGNYMIIPINFINKISPLQKQVTERISDVYINRSYLDSDTIMILLPDNFHLTSTPETKMIESKFGKFQLYIRSDGSTITIIRTFQISKGRYKRSDYAELYTFVSNISKADNQKIMLEKK